MIRHVVMIKFKKDAPQDKIDLFLNEVKRLPHLNPEVRDYSHGMAVKWPRFHSGDFDFANCCDIDSYEAMERYMSHWSHVRMTPFLPDILENLLSFDWEIDYHGPTFDEQAAKAEGEREAKRVIPIHEDPTKAYVPELQGRTIEQAREMLAKVGLELGNVEEVLGSCWAPNRIMVATPGFETVVDKGARIDISVTGDWLTGPALPMGQAAW